MFDWQPVPLDATRSQAYVRAGYWTDETLGQVLSAGLSDARNNAFSVRSEVHPWRGTLGDVDDLARRVASGLAARGIGPGDAVAFQLPNWVEAAATFYAVAYLGAIVVPIVHFYGPKEVAYILRRTRVKALITADQFGTIDFLVNLDAMRAQGLDDLEWHAVVGERRLNDSVAFTDLAAHGPLAAPAVVDPTSPALIAYTSGTTSDPKGVVHVHRSINAEIRQLGAMQYGDADETTVDWLTGAPVGHGIGMLAALLLPVYRRRSIHLIDVWNPAKVLEGMVQDNLNGGAGASIFLTSLLDHPDFDLAVHGPLLRHVGLGGAAIPIAVTERARSLGIECVRSYGSTEHPSITGSDYSAPWDQRCRTDGPARPGVEIRLINERGDDVELGEPGEILSRGPDCSFGYTDPELTRRAFRDGWYFTGDVGVLDSDGCLTITDRKTDVIIRGGENISAVEVEDLLLRLAGVAEVAVVAAPDARLGEHACAYLRMAEGHEVPALHVVQEHLAARGLAKPKWPEELRGIDVFPRTPSGKVQKFRLRDSLRAEYAEGSP